MRIEKGVPLPEQRENYGAGAQALMAEMDVGDSLFAKTPSAFRVAASRLKPKRFTVRKVDGGYRAWRLA